MSLARGVARRIRVLWLVGAFAAALPIHAQRLETAAVSHFRTDTTGRRIAPITVDTAVKKPPSVWWFVGGGAVLGAGAAGLGFALDDPGDAILYEAAVAVIVPASAVLGAGLGWLVHSLIY
jgi:hypothetical protein